MSKRILSLILALCMVGILCSFAHAEGVASLLHPYEETVQVTIMGIDEKDNAVVYDSSKHDRASANENAWIDAYKDLLNIEVTRIRRHRSAERQPEHDDGQRRAAGYHDREQGNVLCAGREWRAARCESRF